MSETTVKMPTSAQIEAFRSTVRRALIERDVPHLAADYPTRGMALDAIEAATTDEAWVSSEVAVTAAADVIDRDWRMLSDADQRWFRNVINAAIASALFA